MSRLEELRPATAYSLRVMASNHVGQSPNSEPLMFTTLEEGLCMQYHFVFSNVMNDDDIFINTVIIFNLSI